MRPTDREIKKHLLGLYNRNGSWKAASKAVGGKVTDRYMMNVYYGSIKNPSISKLRQMGMDKHTLSEHMQSAADKRVSLKGVEYARAKHVMVMPWSNAPLMPRTGSNW